MKKLTLILIAAMVVYLAANDAFAATNKTKTTTANVSVSEIFAISFASTTGTGTPPRSSTTFNFKTVDGSAPNGWYYNALATLDGNGDPNDGRSDVGMICKSNAHSLASPFYLKIKKSSDTLNTTIGYNVSGAFDAGAPTPGTVADGTVTYPTGFKGSTGIGNLGWGELPTPNTTVYTSGTNMYPIYGVLIPISFALVPTGLAVGDYSTTLTYVMVAPV